MTITSKKYCIQYIVQTRSVLGRLHVRNVLMDLYRRRMWWRPRRRSRRPAGSETALIAGQSPGEVGPLRESQPYERFIF